jgi:uncharacterized protein (DUF1499 family)
MSFPSLVAGVILLGCSGMKPDNLGVKDGHLAPCPETMNCVSSVSADKDHFVLPLSYSSSISESMADLKKIILQMRRSKIIIENDHYLSVEFRSAIWRFIDDVEFSFDDVAQIIHVRSASRMGKYDFGINRKRIEMIRTAWNSRGK